ncbi:MlaD family protein [Nocardioides sp.]|uniref:MlaD family protein n=1 Tax=Nocardioides sp. TaxID=35761 RepID=UPI00286BBAD6|nr:MlaD family protein [Nocardioides sp.]
MTGLRGIGIKFAAVAVTAGFLLLLLVNTMNNGVDGDTRGYDAMFEDVSGLRVGDDVKVAGVRVGRVESIEVEDDGARVGFDLQQTQALLDTTKVVMRYQNLLGQRYLALVQAGRRGAVLPADSLVPVDRTDPGFDLTELLNGFRPLFEVLQPADVNALATSMVKVLQGEGGTVEALLQQTTELTGFVADRDQLIGEVLTNLTPVLDNLAGRGTELSATVTELRALMTGLARDRRSIGASIDGVSRLVGSTSDLLRDVKDPAVRALRRFVVVAATMARTRGQLNEALRSFGQTFEALGRATSYENALNVYLCSLSFEVGGRTFNPAGSNGPWSEVCR